MKRLQILLILTLLSCRDQTQLVAVPPCEPHEEVCDGVDNNCNGKIDENLTQNCASECGPGKMVCRSGEWTTCDAPLPKTEVCNGKDDNCDGRVDEEELIGISPCYPGSQSDLLHGECRFGVSRCIGGAFVCQGAVTPTPEACDGKDNNCDGQIDEGSSGGLDLVFAVDYSGSMSDKIDDLRTVTSGWASKYTSRPDLKMALIGVPSPTGQDGVATLMKDISSPNVFVAELNSHTLASAGGQEPTIDVIYQLAQTSNPLQLHWTSGSRRAVVIFTDEEPQSYLSPIVTETQAKNLANSNSLRVFVFTSSPSWYYWNPRPFSQSAALESALDDVVQQGSCQ